MAGTAGSESGLVGVEPAFMRLQHAFTRYLRDPACVAPPAGLPADRLAVYGNAVYANVERFMRDNFPRVCELYADEDWQALMRDYLARHRSDTPLFAELLAEFLAYLEDERDVATDPPYLRELAHFDWLENAIAIDETALDAIACRADGDLLDDRLVVNPVHRLVRYRWPVHALGPGVRPAAPPPRATVLLAFRDRADAFGVLDLNDVAALLFERIRGPEVRPARAVLTELAAELAHPDLAVVVHGGQQLLERWQARDVILGFVPDG
ncbi:MAG: putative DNA-binding domain-containing protein [Gammaproteobacteria bacterium]|nr:putative DNA-binding domain-containing protein [Gammaproteobacteria bacterium]